jgi:hypothetical protein
VWSLAAGCRITEIETPTAILGWAVLPGTQRARTAPEAAVPIGGDPLLTCVDRCADGGPVVAVAGLLRITLPAQGPGRSSARTTPIVIRPCWSY